jgi:hypothetical protein
VLRRGATVGMKGAEGTHATYQLVHRQLEDLTGAQDEPCQEQ